MFKLVIAGGRDFSSIELMTEKLDNLLQDKKEVTIISGGAKGADRLGEVYAQNKGYSLIIMKADWDKFGKSAGFRRNLAMLKETDAVACFWDGKSKGTFHMLNSTRNAGKSLRIIMY